MTKQFRPNIEKYKVLTPDGFKDFAGVSLMGTKPIMRLEFDNGAWVECTHDHKLYVTLETVVHANDLEVGDTVLSMGGDITVTAKIDLGRSEAVYDLIEVEDGHRYYANTILSSNCEFIIFEETLINSLALSDLSGKEPMMKMGQVRWYKHIDPHSTYIVSLDPCLGTGGDYAGIEVFELPSFEQVAEWHHNTTPIQSQVKILREIVKYISTECESTEMTTNVYFSVENNNIGEAALLAIDELGEDTFPGMFMSEPVRKGHVRKFRKGFLTTHKSKVTACAKLKQMIENGTLKINSKPLVSQLKAFVAKGVSFEAKTGEHDDLVSSLLLNVRMVMMLQEWDPAIYEKMHEHVSEELILPMPIYIG